MMNGDVKLIIGKLEANNITIFKALDKINEKLDENSKLLFKYVNIVNSIKSSCDLHREVSDKKEMMLFGFELKTFYTTIVLFLAYILGIISNDSGIIKYVIKIFGGS